jgi:hypothetical protein
MPLKINGASTGSVTLDAPANGGDVTLNLPSSNATIATTANTYTFDGVSPSNRNLLYNGAMQVAQRRTSNTNITAVGYYTADRWNTNIGSLGTWTQSVENDAPTGSGFRKSLKMLCTTADSAPAGGDYNIIQQMLEGQNLQQIAKGTSSAKQLTLSFWVKSNVIGIYAIELRDHNNTRQVSSTYNVAVSNTWEHKVITFPADITGVLNNDNARSLDINFWLGAGTNWTSGILNTTWNTITNANRAVGQTNLAAATNNYWQITGVQLEVGDMETSFEHKSYGQELQECQRYYFHSNSPQTFSAVSGNGAGIVSRPIYTNYANTSFIPFAVPMRATPTVTVYNTSTGASGSVRLQSTGANITAAADRVGSTGFGGLYCSGNNFTVTDYAYVPFIANAEL